MGWICCNLVSMLGVESFLHLSVSFQTGANHDSPKDLEDLLGISTCTDLSCYLPYVVALFLLLHLSSGRLQISTQTTPVMYLLNFLKGVRWHSVGFTLFPFIRLSRFSIVFCSVYWKTILCGFG